jgi:tRNA threonylcarbamoyladenosine biosynthesis protein TsaB
MRILSVDTATTSCSVAITQDRSLLAEITNDTAQTHAKHLMGMIETALGLSGLTMPDLDGFAVTRGPGSFTGLRIGIATVKGLAAATGKPLVGVSTLAALALQAAGPSLVICPLLDARRGEVYFTRYRYEDGKLAQLIEEGVAPPGEAVAGLKEKSLFVGGGAMMYRDLLATSLGELARFAPAIQDTIRASTIARLSLPAFEDGPEDDIESLVPVYIRKSDAEIHRSKLRDQG